MTPEDEKTIDRLVRAVNLAYNSPGRLFWRGLLWGLGRGLGATLGLAIVLGMLFYLMQLTGLDEVLRNLVDNLQKIADTLNSSYRR